jgi:hypothetical protein
MAVLDTAIYAFDAGPASVDGRIKSGHDDLKLRGGHKYLS